MDTLQWTWGLNPGPFALESDTLPLSHRGSPNWFVSDLVSTQSDQHLCYSLPGDYMYNMSSDVRKPVFGVPDKARPKPGCANTGGR